MEQKIKKLTSILFLLLCVPLSAENKKADLIEPEAHAIITVSYTHLTLPTRIFV